MNEYEQKQQEKARRYEELASKHKQESANRFQAARDIQSHIPFGQPILVGHHSEGRHRSDLNRIDNNMRKSIEADEKAKYYARKAENIANSKVISSDDPQAIEKLTAKLDTLLRTRELMKQVNKVIRKDISYEEKVKAIVSAGSSEKQAHHLLVPDYLGRVGFPKYSFSNLSGNIKNVRDRIESLQRRSAASTTTRQLEGIEMIDNVEANRIQLFFEPRPTPDQCKILKQNGFRWTPSKGCWQAYRSVKNRMEHILSLLTPKP